jgi:O-antigen ligase
LAFVAYKASPTLRARLGYFSYSFDQYKAGNRQGNYSDPGRILSYDIAFRQIAKSPLTGYGAGDLMSTMKLGYDKWYPDVADRDRLVPHNQFLCSAIAAGIPSMVLLLVWWALCLREIPRSATGLLARGGWLLLSVPLFVDPSFEIQLGIAVYLFYLLLYRAFSSQVSQPAGLDLKWSLA